MIEQLISKRDDLLIRRLILAPGEAMRWHTDLCRRFTVVISGSLLRIEFRGSPESLQVCVRPGQADWDLPDPRVHRAVNVGPESYEEVVTFFLDRPEQTPQPEPGD